MSLRYPFKRSAEKLNYGVDWQYRIASGDSIAASAWTVPSPLSKDGDSFTDTTTEVLISGGVDGEDYVLVNKITTTTGLIEEVEINLYVRD